MHRGKAPVLVDQYVHLGAHRVTHRFHYPHRALFLLLRDPGAPGARQRIELEGIEALLHDLFRRARIVRRLLQLIAPAVGVDADLLPAAPAEEVIDRLLARLPDDIPQRLLDPRDGAEELDRAAPLRVIVEGDLREVLDVEGAAARGVATERVEVRDHGRVAVVLGVGLAPAVHAGVGLDLHEDQVLAPAGMNAVALDRGDFHGGTRKRREVGESKSRRFEVSSTRLELVSELRRRLNRERLPYPPS